MKSARRDTIAAVATPAGRGGIGIVRVSGGDVPRIARAVVGRVPAPRYATYCEFRDARGEVVDMGISLYFPAPGSYTGEDVLELHGHGGPMVTGAILAACLDAGARIAEPGEFTQRAFLEGKIDLAQAEAVADLIDATSREAVRSAVRSVKGEFSAALKALQEELTDLRALTEAMLDFPEEEVEIVHREDARRRLHSLGKGIETVLSRCRTGSLLRTGVHVVLAGKPNVGKSSLLNRLVGEDRAIVTSTPGTTRDVLRESIEIHGVQVTLADTAGLRAGEEEVERLGISRARDEIEHADIVMVVFDASTGMTQEDCAVLDQLEPRENCIHVYNKVDMVSDAAPGVRGSGQAWVSAMSGAGIDDLKDLIAKTTGWRSTGETVFLARERHLRALDVARQKVRAAERQIAETELFAEELRLAQRALSEITGEHTADELLGEIFSRFCIGK